MYNDLPNVAVSILANSEDFDLKRSQFMSDVYEVARNESSRNKAMGLEGVSVSEDDIASLRRNRTNSCTKLEPAMMDAVHCSLEKHPESFLIKVRLELKLPNGISSNLVCSPCYSDVSHMCQC